MKSNQNGVQYQGGKEGKTRPGFTQSEDFGRFDPHILPAQGGGN